MNYNKHKKGNWAHVEGDCIKILSYLSDNPMSDISFRHIENEFNLGHNTIQYLINSGKLLSVALKYGYKFKVPPKYNCIEVVKWTYGDERFGN